MIRRALALTLSAALLAAPGSTAAATPLPLVPPPPDLTSLVPFAEAPVEKPPIAALDLPLPPSPAELPPMPLASIVVPTADKPTAALAPPGALACVGAAFGVTQ